MPCWRYCTKTLAAAGRDPSVDGRWTCASMGRYVRRRLWKACCSHHTDERSDPEFVEYRGLNTVLEGMVETQQAAYSAAALEAAKATAKLLQRKLQQEEEKRLATEQALATMYVT